MLVRHRANTIKDGSCLGNQGDGPAVMFTPPGHTRAGVAGCPGPCDVDLNQSRQRPRPSKKHLWSIINAIILKVSNGPAESINSRIKTVKVRSRGFRNKQRFTNAIYFHLGGLDLYPESVRK